MGGNGQNLHSLSPQIDDIAVLQNVNPIILMGLGIVPLLLFTGDEMESGQVLLFVRDRNLPLEQVVSAHKRNMEKLAARRSEYDFICPAHNGTLLQPDLYLNDFIALDQELLDGIAEIQPDTAGFGFAPNPDTNDMFAKMGPKERAQHGQASIVYLKKEG